MPDPQANYSEFVAALFVFGVGVLGSVGMLIKWLTSYLPKRAEFKLHKERELLKQQTADKDHQRKEDEALLKQQIDEQAALLRVLERYADNQTQMLIQHGKELEILSGIKAEMTATGEKVTSLDTYTRQQLEPIFQLIQAIHKIAESNQVQGKQSLEMLQALKGSIDSAIAQVKKRETSTDSQPITPVRTSELKTTPIDDKPKGEAA